MAHKFNAGAQKPLNLVAEALKLDSDNDDENAYLKYLESISLIASTLMSNETCDRRDSRYMSVEQKQKLISVARQCLDRVETLTQKLEDRSAIPPGHLNVELVSPVIAVEVPVLERQTNGGAEKTEETIAEPSTAIFESHRCPLVGVATGRREPNGSSVLEFIDWIANEEQSPRSSRPKKSPLEKVYEENQALLAAFRSRMENCNDHVARANISLGLQRRLTENLFVARKKQEEYVKQRREEEELSLKEAARRTLPDSNEPPQKRLLKSKIVLYEKQQNWIKACQTQLNSSPKDVDLVESIVRRIFRDRRHPITDELQTRRKELCDLIQSILVEAHRSNTYVRSPPDNYREAKDGYDGGVGLKSNSRKMGYSDSDSDESNSKDVVVKKEPLVFQSVIAANVKAIEVSLEETNAQMKTLKESIKKPNRFNISLKRFRSKDKAKSDSWTESNEKELEEELIRLEKDALKKQLETIGTDVRLTIDDVIEAIVFTFEPMSSPENSDRCYGVIEEFLMPTVWPSLMRLCRLVHGSDEDAVRKAMLQLRHCSPMELGCSAKFSDSLLCSKSLDKATGLLQAVPGLGTPSQKLQNLVFVAKLVCQSRDGNGVAKESPQKSKDSAIGADDLIPLLNYICIKADVPQLISECHLLGEVIDQRFLMGEEGYCWTTLTTALHFLKTMEKKSPVPDGIESTV